MRNTSTNDPADLVRRLRSLSTDLGVLADDLELYLAKQDDTAPSVSIAPADTIPTGLYDKSNRPVHIGDSVRTLGLGVLSPNGRRARPGRVVGSDVAARKLLVAFGNGLRERIDSHAVKLDASAKPSTLQAR